MKRQIELIWTCEVRMSEDVLAYGLYQGTATGVSDKGRFLCLRGGSRGEREG